MPTMPLLVSADQLFKANSKFQLGDATSGHCTILFGTSNKFDKHREWRGARVLVSEGCEDTFLSFDEANPELQPFISNHDGVSIKLSKTQTKFVNGDWDDFERGAHCDLVIKIIKWSMSDGRAGCLPGRGSPRVAIRTKIRYAAIRTTVA